MATLQQERKYPLGKIEPNSLKYFGACTMGGIIGTLITSALLVKDRANILW